MLCEAAFEIVGLSGVATTCLFTIEDVNEISQSSPTRTRTLNLAVNSRSLYRLSYRGFSL
jgi:hypothetical protein